MVQTEQISLPRGSYFPPAHPAAMGFDSQSLTISFETFETALLRDGTVGHLDRLLSDLFRCCKQDRRIRAKEAETIAFRATSDPQFCRTVRALYRKAVAAFPPGSGINIYGVSPILGHGGSREIALHRFDSVCDEDAALNAVRCCFASSFSDDAVNGYVDCNCHPLSVKPFVVIEPALSAPNVGTFSANHTAESFPPHS